MDFFKNPTEIGWIVIGFVSFLIFIIVMTRGFKLDVKNKSISVGKQIDSKLALFKKEEEQMRNLFKETTKLDEHLTADERQSVRNLDGQIAEIFAPYFKSDMPLSFVILAISSGNLLSGSFCSPNDSIFCRISACSVAPIIPNEFLALCASCSMFSKSKLE